MTIGSTCKVGVPAGRGKIVIHTIPPSQNGAILLLQALSSRPFDFLGNSLCCSEPLMHHALAGHS
eukprot:484856-Amphidinium_carterae.1